MHYIVIVFIKGDGLELLHLTINGEVIKTTFEHPFYVKDVGFVEAGKLQVGDKLVDSRGNVLVVEEKKLEITDKPVKVYNLRSIIFIRIMLAKIGYWFIMRISMLRERVVLNLPRMILSLVISLVNQHTKIKLLNGVGQIERLQIQ